MAEHVWSVICRKGVQDKETNIVSLHEVTEKITARIPPGIGIDDEIAAGRRLLPVQLELVTWWVRSGEEPEETAGRLIMIAPDGQEVSRHEFQVDLTGPHGSRRTIAKIPGIPADLGSGRFWFVMERQDGESWTAMTRIPLEVELVRDEAEEA